ncbi:MAG: hypothetical protein O3B70_09275 [Bacteroidetes bacterium]|nr:hypothetical protein [Bacteroidota bacterium]MDA0904513.1 hypothetical protein [Bacteroidota bacterium]MDA1242257.1 hypothetical protein [Bacteroidota bacterium]
MIQHRIPVLLALGSFAALIAAAGGVAAEQNKDRTGAPGSSPVCTNCHNGSGSATSSFEVLDAGNGQPVTAYTAGQDYVVRMVVDGGTGSYGAQGTVVLDNGDNAGSFSNPSANTQLENVGGRHIMEHNSPSASPVFEATWTAPASGSGPANFYMSGLAVNGNDATSGDVYAGSSMTLPEATSSMSTIENEEAPGPWLTQGTWQWVAPAQGRLTVMDGSGRVVIARNVQQGEGIHWTLGGLNIVHFATPSGSSQRWKLAGTR